MAALKPIEICHPVPEENVNSLAQAFRNVSLFDWLPKYCQWASVWELAEAESILSQNGSCHSL